MWATALIGYEKDLKDGVRSITNSLHITMVVRDCVARTDVRRKLWFIGAMQKIVK